MGDLDILSQVLLGVVAVVAFVVYSIGPAVKKHLEKEKEFLPERDGKVIDRKKLGKNAQYLLTEFEKIEDSRERCNELYKMLLYMHESAGGRTDGLERDWRLAFTAASLIAGVAVLRDYPWLALFLLVLAGVAFTRPSWSDRFAKWYET